MARIGVNDAVPVNATVDLGATSAAIFDLAGFNQTLAGITKNSSAGTVTNSGASPSTLTTTGTTMFAGVIQNGTGTTAVAVTGGKLTLSGINTYTGGTSVSGGTAVAGNSTSSFGSGSTSVTGSGIVAGTGKTGGAVTIGTTTAGGGGTITAGSGATSVDTIGTLSSNAQTWNRSGTYAIKVATPGATPMAGTSYDTLAIVGTLNLATLDASNRFTLAVINKTGGAFTAGSYLLASTSGIIPPTSINGGATITTAGTDLSNLFVLSIDGIMASADSYTVSAGSSGGDATQLVLNYSTEAAPEPAAMMLGGLAMLPLATRRKRRR